MMMNRALLVQTLVLTSTQLAEAIRIRFHPNAWTKPNVGRACATQTAPRVVAAGTPPHPIQSGLIAPSTTATALDLAVEASPRSIAQRTLPLSTFVS